MRTADPTNVVLKLAGLLGLLLATCPIHDVAQAQSGQLSRGDPVRGETIYQGCTDCHSIDKNDVGPKHRGVVGRRAGTVPGYGYSPALKNSGLTWDEATLDRWLIDPGALVPGTKMFFEVQDPQDRADVIAYLKQQK